MRSRHAVVPLTIAALIALGSCTRTASFEESAENFLEDDDEEVATALGLTFDDASCQEPVDKEVGTTFTCTAVASDGVTYTFVGEITSRDQFTLSPSSPPPGGAGSVPSASTTPPTTTPPTTAIG